MIIIYTIPSFFLDLIKTPMNKSEEDKIKHFQVKSLLKYLFLFSFHLIIDNY